MYPPYWVSSKEGTFQTDIDILVDKLKSWIKMVEIGYNKYTGFFVKYEDAIS